MLFTSAGQVATSKAFQFFKGSPLASDENKFTRQGRAWQEDDKVKVWCDWQFSKDGMMESSVQQSLMFW